MKVLDWFRRRERGMVRLKEFELERLQQVELAWSAAFDACVETGWDTNQGGRAIDNVSAHIRLLKSNLDTVTKERDALWLQIDPESAVLA